MMNANGKPWPASNIERRKVSDLKPYERNPRLHSTEQIALIAASISEWGWTYPILVDEDDEIIAGHGRLEAAKQLGLTDVPVMVARGWTEAQKQAYLIADNKLPELSRWDYPLLRVEVSELQAAGFDMPLIGFSEFELAAFGGQTVEDIEREWAGMPEYRQEAATAFRTIIIHFKDAEAVDEFARLIGQSFNEKTRYTWFPPVQRENLNAKRYVT